MERLIALYDNLKASKQSSEDQSHVAEEFYSLFIRTSEENLRDFATHLGENLNRDPGDVLLVLKVLKEQMQGLENAAPRIAAKVADKICERLATAWSA